MTRALVFGGGGNTGFCWAWGVVASLYDEGVDLANADLMVGTSSGSTGALELSGGANPHKLLEPLEEEQARERDSEPAPDRFTEVLKQLLQKSRDATEIRAGIGAMALSATAGSERGLRRTVTGYMTVHEWPRQRLLIPAVDAASGELVVFSQDSGVELIDAVAATCAVPGVWAPVTIGDRRYIDGSVRSPTNADLAAGHDRVLVLAPLPEIRGMPGAGLREALEPIEAQGRAFVVVPDDASRKAIGHDLTDLSRRPGAARAGLAQGASLAAAIREFWLTGRGS